MIGGHDICIRARKPAMIAEGAWRIVRAIWTSAQAEDAETGELLEDWHAVPNEVLIYQDESARQSWLKDGATCENMNSMIHLICDRDSLTLVIDDPTDVRISKMIQSIREHSRQDIFWIPSGDRDAA